MSNLYKIALISYALVIPSFTYAQTVQAIIGNVKTLLNSVFGILVTIATIVFIWGVIKFITAAGSEKGIKDAKGIITWGIVGLAVIAGAWGVVAVLINFFGLTGTPQGFNVPSINFQSPSGGSYDTSGNGGSGGLPSTDGDTTENLQIQDCLHNQGGTWSIQFKRCMIPTPIPSLLPQARQKCIDGGGSWDEYTGTCHCSTHFEGDVCVKGGPSSTGNSSSTCQPPQWDTNTQKYKCTGGCFLPDNGNFQCVNSL